MFKHAAFFAAALVGPAALAGLAATSSPAAAAEPVPTAIVHYNDLDLTSARDQDVLHTRLMRTARAICNMDGPHTASRLPSASEQACFRTATAKIDNQIAAAIQDQGDYVRFGG